VPVPKGTTPGAGQTGTWTVWRGKSQKILAVNILLKGLLFKQPWNSVGTISGIYNLELWNVMEIIVQTSSIIVGVPEIVKVCILLYAPVRISPP
jgi:hypothetical protein